MEFMSALAGSLRRKIMLGYGAVAVVVTALAALAVVEMRVLEAQVTSGERIGQFFGTALELRRFEKNYLLYRQASDRQETLEYAARASELLVGHGEVFARFAAAPRIEQLRLTLDEHAALMDSLDGSAADSLREARIRQAGKEIVTLAEAWASAERSLLQEQLARHRQWLLASIGVVAALVILIGHLLVRRVALPLKQLELEMEAVAAGRLTQLTMNSGDREIASLTTAFNHVLDELARRQGQLVRAEKLAALGTLLSGVAHELNNPLSNISTSCEILDEELCTAGRQDGKARDAAFEKELVEQIETETWRARRIVRSLLDYAREREFRRETLPLAQLADDTLRLVRGLVPARVEVAIRIAEDLSISGDKQRLQQVLFNLLGNAIDAVAGAGRIDIAARVTRQPLPADLLVFGRLPNSAAWLEIEIVDNGQGIAPETLARIFDPFFTTKAVGHGSGLGLFIVFEIIEEHGACIAVGSRPDVGSRFVLRFPHMDATT